jgi:hypothetical protein
LRSPPDPACRRVQAAVGSEGATNRFDGRFHRVFDCVSEALERGEGVEVRGFGRAAAALVQRTIDG